MNVAELIEKLREMPPMLRVVTLGYEGGYDDVKMISRLQLAVGAHDDSRVYGQHTKAEDVEGYGCPVEEAVLIAGRQFSSAL
jgi:hypothetical protein